MLRAKKNAILKTSPLITFLKNFQIDPETSYTEKTDKIKHHIRYFDSYYKDLLKINVIKHFVFESIPYSIIKDEITETWFLTCTDLVILYIERTEIDQFKMDFLFSEIYNFIVYYDVYRDCYIAFCLSHTKSQILNILPKLYINNKHHHKYFILSHFLLPSTQQNNDNDNDTYFSNIFIQQSVGFIILNKNVHNQCHTNFKSNLIYYDDVGFGTKIKILDNLISIILVITQCYKYLPINYITF